MRTDTGRAAGACLALGAGAAIALAATTAQAQDGEGASGRDDLEAMAAPTRPAEAEGATGTRSVPPLRWVCEGGVPRLADQPEDEHRFIPADTPLVDWLQLATGETLGGELLRMRDGSLEFDSDELGVVTLDWEDVRAMRIRTPHGYVREDLKPLRGTAGLGNGELVVCTQDGEARVPPGQVLSIVEGAGRERDRWSLDVTAGYSGAFGTSRQDTLNGQVRIRREDAISRFTGRFDVNYAQSQIDEVSPDTGARETRTDVTVNNLWGTVGLDFFVSRRFYITALQGRVGYDELQNLQLRATPGAGVGYRIFDGGPDWDVELGGGYQYTRFREVQAGRAETRSDAGVRLATFVEVDVTGDFTVIASHVATMQFTDFGQSNFLTKATLSYEIGDVVDVQASLYWDRLRDPEPTPNPVAPDEPFETSKDSITVTAGLGISL